MKKYLHCIIPFLVGTALSVSMGLTIWIGFFLVFIPIGLSVSIGFFISVKYNNPDLGRKICLSIVSIVFLVFLGIMQRENMQIEETVFYFAYFINTGIFTRVLIHYAIAKVVGPLIFGRGFCGWGCYTAALLEWLPIKENKVIPKKYTYIRIPVLIISLLIPFILIQLGYDYYNRHIYSPVNGAFIETHKLDQFIWFLVGYISYYIIGIILAFVFRKKRAFCKIFCPVSLVMKLQTRFSLIKVGPNKKNKCIGCGKCNKECPMDIDVQKYIQNGKRVLSSECIFCRNCICACPVKAIK
ncbi:MAG: 4Fe-4S dicluster domain-containing protein [Treponema sp.]|nr:4Fe-4S dicluster domain-containing protein [Treponema sp.]